jgi:hypothetical protein
MPTVNTYLMVVSVTSILYKTYAVATRIDLFTAAGATRAGS